ncbi:hypothetical protein M0811_04873 [Anaeramoeba ignava]|uniref:Uncharacterized protein n=1 Tax=Anaeramoeba ignava TaxID=1746090 RepID=A0A9Q0LW63_ANAIG|nr:hypothetical protein M0811_04873 [Anaeramoeba ignava]
MKILFLIFLFTNLILIISSDVSISNFFHFPSPMEQTYVSLIDSNQGVGYFADTRIGEPSRLYKYDLQTLELLEYLILPINNAQCGAIDVDNQLAYIGGYDYPMRIVKVDLSLFQVQDVVSFYEDVTGIWSMNIDLVGQKLYASMDDPDVYVKKVDLSKNGFLYVSTDTDGYDDPIIHKIRLSNFTEMGNLPLNASDESGATFGGIDSSSQLMYVGTNAEPMRIVKINLTDFTKLDVFTCDEGTNNAMGAYVNFSAELGYFLSEDGCVIEVNLTELGVKNSTCYDTSEVYSMAVDEETHKSYVGMGESNIGIGDLLTMEQDSEIVRPIFLNPTVFLIDQIAQTAYLIFDTDYPLLAKVDLKTFQLVDFMILSLEDGISGGEIDEYNGFAYIFHGYGLEILKIRLSNFSVDSDNIIDPYGFIMASTFDHEDHILYVAFGNDTEEEYTIVEISSPALVNQRHMSLNNIWDVFDVKVDPYHQYIYVWGQYGEESANFLKKIQISDFTQIGSANLTEYNFDSLSLDITHEYMYFGTCKNCQNSGLELTKLGDNPNSAQICRVDLSTMQIKDCQEIENVNDFFFSFIESSSNWGYFVTSFFNSVIGDYSTMVFQIETSSNKLLGNATIEDSLVDFMGRYDFSTNYGYLVGMSSNPVPFMRLTVPSPENPNFSNSGKLIFSTLIFGLMIILGFF